MSPYQTKSQPQASDFLINFQMRDPCIDDPVCQVQLIRESIQQFFNRRASRKGTKGDAQPNG
jgi:hypothetical protein